MEMLSPHEKGNVPESGEPHKCSNGTANDYHEELISKLPRNNGWISVSHIAGELYLYQGFWHSRHFLERIILAQKHFLATPSDIVVCSAPKTGTTWLKALTFAIMSRRCFDDQTSPLLTTVPHHCMFFLEVDIVKSQPKLHGFPLLATHIPYTSLPESMVSSGCKIIYICREPKDAFVSLWHFWGKLFQEFGFLPLEEAFELFCEGISLYGPYWDHVLGYWKASLERPDKVLFLKYEDMKSDTRLYVKVLAEFMGQPFSEEEERDGAVERIVRLCSFENLSNLEVNKNGRHHPAVPNHAFFRKGKVGDWENHLTTEMKERLDRITEQKLKGSGLTFGSK